MSFSRQVGSLPYVFPLLAVAVGMVLASHLPTVNWYWWVRLVLLAGIVGVFFIKKKKKNYATTAWVLLLALVAAGAARYAHWRGEQTQGRQAFLAIAPTDTTWHLVPRQLLRQNQYYATYAAYGGATKLLTSHAGTAMQAGPLTVAAPVLLLWPTNQQPLSIGVGVLAKGSFEALAPAPNPDMFDAATYYARQGYAGQLKATQVLAQQAQPQGIGPVLLQTSHRARLWCGQVISTHIADTAAVALAEAVLLGNKQNLPYHLKQNFAAAGIVHLLAVSGLHTGILYWLLTVLLQLVPAFRYAQLVKAVLALVVLWGFALVTGLAAPVVRAALMFSLFALGRVFRRDAHGINILFGAGFFMLLVQPAWLFSAGFQLSFLAVLGIFLVLPVWQAYSQRWPWVWRSLGALLATSLAAQLLTLPLVLLYFNQFPMYFLPANVVVAPFSFVMVLGGLLLLGLGWWPAAAHFLGRVFEVAAYALDAISAWFSQLPGAVVQHVFLFEWQVGLYYAVVVLLLVWWLAPTWRRLLWVLAGVAALGVAFGANLLLRTQSHHLCFFHVPGQSAVAYFQNGFGRLVCTPSLLKKPSAFNYYVKNHLIKNAPLGWQTDTLHSQRVQKVVLGPHTIWFNLHCKKNPHPALPALQPTDMVVAGPNFYTHLWPLTPQHHVVIDGSTHPLKQANLHQKLLKQQANVHLTQQKALLIYP